MNIVQVQLPDELQSSIGRRIAEGRVANETAFILEAAARFADDLDAEDELIQEAQAGMADAAAGKYVTLASAEDVDAHHERTMARLRERMAEERK